MKFEFALIKSPVQMSDDKDLKGAQAMADAMAHVLAKKPKKKGASILSRSKSAMELLAKEKQERKEKKARGV